MRCPHLRVLPNLIAASLSYISLCYERTNQSAFRSFDTTATCSSATDLSQKLLTFLTVIRTAWVLLTSLSLFLSASLFLHACLSIIDEKLYNGWYVGYISPVSSEWISDAMLLDMISLSTSSDKKKTFANTVTWNKKLSHRKETVRMLYNIEIRVLHSYTKALGIVNKLYNAPRLGWGWEIVTATSFRTVPSFWTGWFGVLTRQRRTVVIGPRSVTRRCTAASRWRYPCSFRARCRELHRLSRCLLITACPLI